MSYTLLDKVPKFRKWNIYRIVVSVRIPMENILYIYKYLENLFVILLFSENKYWI